MSHTSTSHVTHQRGISHTNSVLSCRLYLGVCIEAWCSFPSHINEACLTTCTSHCRVCIGVLSRIHESCRTFLSHGTHLRVMVHIIGSRHAPKMCFRANCTGQCVVRHGITVYFKSMSHVTHHWVTWHTSTSHATICMRDGTGECVVWGMVVHVIAHLWVMSHITESCHIHPRVMSHIHESWHTMYDRMYWRLWVARLWVTSHINESRRTSASHVTNRRVMAHYVWQMILEREYGDGVADPWVTSCHIPTSYLTLQRVTLQINESCHAMYDRWCWRVSI